jgi:hypothetical protein
LSRTFVRTGSERFETARLTTDRPRARFSCMTESFTSGSLQLAVGAPRAVPRVDGDRIVDRIQAAGLGRTIGGYLLSIFSFRHHRHHGVDRVDDPSSTC